MMNHIYINMDIRGFVLVFQAERNKLAGSFDSVGEVRPALDHALVDQLAERFILANITGIEKKFVPETRVYQVAGSVLSPTDI